MTNLCSRKDWQFFSMKPAPWSSSIIPTLCACVNIFSQNNTAYFVMDYYDGVSLSDYVRRRGTGLDPKPAIAIMLPMLAGLEVVHRQGYLHRDIKARQHLYDRPR